MHGNLSDYTYVVLLAGIIIVIVTSLNQLRERHRRNARKQVQRDTALEAAQEAHRKTQMLTRLPQAKVQTSVTLPDPSGIPFTGVMQGKAAKWEVEIHKLGRQIIGQIDSKMAALQAMTLDANRTANRLEILVEHLEQFARTQIQEQPRAEVSETIISASELPTEAAPLAEVLEELTEELEGIRKNIRQSTAFTEETQHATILRLVELQKEELGNDRAADLRGEAVMLANYGLDFREIARRLGISQGEVEIMLQMQEQGGIEPLV
jgi:DNA-directed RNA polymerase specialized sigma24 family protein